MIGRIVGSRPGLVALGVALAAAFVVPSEAAAQEGLTTGAIQGRITDNTGEPLAAASVVVTNAETGTARTVETNAEGRYTVGFLRSGRYTVRAEFPPLEPIELGPFRVSIGDTRVVNVGLQPIEVEAIVARVGPENQVDVTRGGVTELVDEEQIENLPTLGRDFTDFINLSGLVSPAPEVGTGGQFSLGGGRTSATNVQIDGVDANNSFFGENRGSSRIPFTFSLESIKEFQIVTNGFDVEFGNYTGGVVNVVTKGGTNEFQGSGFFFGRDEALTGRTFDGQEPVDFSSQQFGFRFSGPIVRDKAHFYVSLDGQQKDQPTFALVPDVWCPPDRGGCTPERLDAFFDEFRSIMNEVYGLSSSELDANLGTFEETEDNLAIFARVDWQLNDRHMLTVRNNYTDFENLNDRVNPEEALTHGGAFEDEFNSFVTELTSVLGERSQGYNTFRFQWSDETRPRPGNSLLPEFDIEPVFEFQGEEIELPASDIEFFGDGIVFANQLDEEKFQFVDNLTWSLGEAGRHTLKAGTNNIFSEIGNLFWLFGNGDYSFESLDDLRNRTPERFRRNLLETGEAPFAEFNVSEWSFYVQDEWQVNDRFLLSLGLRYDTDVFEDEAADNVALREAFAEMGRDISTADVPEDRNNWGPRVSFTYDFRGNETSVLRGGVGLLYGRAPFVLHGNVMQSVPPLLSIDCRDDEVPPPDVQSFPADGSGNPTSCVDGGELGGVPQFSLWDEDFENPQSWKLNVGYEQVLENGWRMGVDLLYGKTTNNFNVQNINLTDPVFFTAIDNRPVFSSRFSVDRFFTGRSRANPDFAEVFFNTDDAESEATSLTFKLGRRFEETGLRFDASYTFNNIWDNTSFFCCTASEGFRTKEIGAHNPNQIGDEGDEDNGTWGHADFERRHVFILSGTWQAPLGFEVSGIWRSQQGTPYSLIVEGDINGDGQAFNDRAPVFDNLVFETPEDAAAWQALLAGGGDDAGECLRDELGRVARRNTCNNPWFHSVDLHIGKEFVLPRGAFELTADLFNVLNGLDDDWGQFNVVDNAPLEKEGLDDNDAIIYSVNDQFGEESPLPFTQLQFQAQLGVRYRF